MFPFPWNDQTWSNCESLVEIKQTASKLRLNAMKDKYAKNYLYILSGPNIKMRIFCP